MNLNKFRELVKLSFVRGHIIDQESFLKEEYLNRSGVFDESSRSTYYRHKRESLRRGIVGKIVIEACEHDIERYPPRLLKTILIPHNSELDRIFSTTRYGAFKFYRPWLDYNSHEEDKVLAISAEALRKVIKISKMVCKLTIYDLAYDVSITIPVKHSLEPYNKQLFPGQELTLDLLRIKYPKPKAERIKQLRNQVELLKQQLKPEEAEFYYNIRKSYCNIRKRKELSQDEIDRIGCTISPALGELLHLERRSKEAEKDLKEGEVEFAFDFCRTARRFRQLPRTFCKDEHALMLIPQIIHDQGVDYTAFIMVYSGWYEPPKLYFVRGYKVIKNRKTIKWIDPSIPIRGRKVNQIRIEKMLNK